MIPAIDFPESNFTFGKPKDMTDEQCASLPVWKGADQDGQPIIITKWQLSKEDLEEIARTGVIYIQIVGHRMQPIAPFTENPFLNEQTI